MCTAAAATAAATVFCHHHRMLGQPPSLPPSPTLLHVQPPSWRAGPRSGRSPGAALTGSSALRSSNCEAVMAPGSIETACSSASLALTSTTCCVVAG